MNMMKITVSVFQILVERRTLVNLIISVIKFKQKNLKQIHFIYTSTGKLFAIFY